ncbi:MAG: ribulose-phosphate 3-epimerase [Planctomycetota bacterium]
MVAPSLLSADFARLAEELARIEAAGADWHHVDVMDGHFVPNLTLGPPVVQAIHGASGLPLDVHVMIERPWDWGGAFAEAGAHVLTFHYEACANTDEIERTLDAFRDAGVPKIGISIKPETRAEPLEPFFDRVDLILVMSVSPGFGGQAFQDDVLPKVRRLRALGWQGRLEMDGGIAPDTIRRCVEAGCDTVVAGSAVYGPPDAKAAIEALRREAGGAVASS